MDIKRKLEIIEQSIKSLAGHDDADLALRNAALDKVVAIVEAERTAATERVSVAIEKMVSGSEK